MKTPTASTAGFPSTRKGWRGIFWIPVLRGRLGLWVGVAIVLLIVFAAVFAPWIAPYDPLAQNLAGRLLPPMSVDDVGLHLVGTDELGRDVLSRTLYGARIPLLVGFLAVLTGGLVGIVTGAVAGYFGGTVDSLLSRIADIQMSIPGILVALSLLAFAGQNVGMLVAAIAITGWPTFFRLIRVQAMSLAGRGFVESSISAGARASWVIRKHIMPNVVGLIAVVSTLDFSRAVLMEAGLSYLGLGVQPPTPDWGVMVAGGQSHLADAWWIAGVPGVAIILLVLGVNMIGDWLVDEQRSDVSAAAIETVEVQR